MLKHLLQRAKSADAQTDTSLEIKREGSNLVKRDANGQVVVARPVPKEKRTHRAVIHELTNGGFDLYVQLHNMAMGKPRKNADGSEEVPTFEVSRAAAVNLHEFMYGKAVAETEVNKAEEEQRKSAQLRAMSEEDLQKVIEGEYEEAVEGDDTK